jgi:chromosomal replication initiator protein DnaA
MLDTSGDSPVDHPRRRNWRFMERHIWMTALARLEQELPEATCQWLRAGRLIATQAPDRYILQIGSAAAKEQLETRSRIQLERALTEALGSSERVKVTVMVVKNKAPHQGPAESGDPLFPDESLNAIDPPAAEPARHAPARTSVAERRRLRQLRQGGASATRGAPGVHVKPDLPRAVPAPRVLPSEPVESPSWLNDRYTFENFIVGGGNNFAFAASVAVGDAPGEAYNPLFIYGGVGLGKTHLLHAVAHAVAPKGYRVLYVTSETFTNEIINAILHRKTEEFRAKYRNVDVLLVDDIQFIAGKDSTEEEFFHTFNALHEAQKQIVMCSDRPPKEIDLEERLRSRFEWGLIVDIQPPDLETRLAILRAKADALGIQISDDVMNFLAERVHTNVRELEGMLNRVVAFARLQHAPLSLDIARRALMSLSPADRPRRRITTGEIAALVSTYYHVTLDDLRSVKRDKQIVLPRQVAMWLMRQETEASLLEIGSELGGRDHTTVLHGCVKIERELRREGSQLAQEVAELRQQLVNG